MSRVMELREKRAALYQEARAVLDEAEKSGRDLAGEDLARWESQMAQVDAWGQEIEARERDEATREKLNGPQPEPRFEKKPDESRGNPNLPAGVTKYDVAFRTYLRAGMRSLTNDQVALLNSNFVAAADGAESRALSTTGTAGGYMIPQGFLNDMVRVMKAFGSVRTVARVITTESGNTLPWPSVDDTANVGAILAENTQVTEQDVAWTTAQLVAYMYTSKLVRVSLQLLQDTAISVESVLSDVLGERLGRIQNQHFTTGTGTGQPQGIVTGATSGVTAAGATAVTADELINLAYSVDSAYRLSGNAKYMMGDTTAAAIRKLKDSTGQYLWQPSLQAGVPDVFFGYPIVINPDMPAMTTGNKSVLFGDFREAYIIREVRGIQTMRLEERYADYLQVGFIAFNRVDGKVRNAAAMRALTQA